LELLSEIFNEGGIKIISLSNIRPIESASLPQYLGCNTVFDMCLRITFLHRKTVSLQSNISHRSKVIAKDRALERVNVYEIMTKPVISVHSDMDIRYCARLLTRLGLSRCPVLDNGKIVGVVSLTNIVLNGLHIV
jgi:CBS domain-containing protein